MRCSPRNTRRARACGQLNNASFVPDLSAYNSGAGPNAQISTAISYGGDVEYLKITPIKCAIYLQCCVARCL